MEGVCGINLLTKNHLIMCVECGLAGFLQRPRVFDALILSKTIRVYAMLANSVDAYVAKSLLHVPFFKILAMNLL